MARTPRPSAPSVRLTQAGAPSASGLSVAIASVLGAVLPATAWAQTVITPDGLTATGVASGGGTHTVTTATTRGGNAFNSFNVFKVGSGDTVNLHLPAGTQNLVNLVWDEQVSINGLLNSYKGAGTATPGGRVFFAAPNGFVVGASGVVNVGALSVATPRADDMLRMGTELAGNGAMPTFDLLLKGALPATADASVSIAGRVNALDDVRIQARAIDVTGTIFVEGGSGADKLDSQVAVNVGAGAGTRLVQDGNNILLVAQDSLLEKAAVNLGAGSTLRANGGEVIVQSDDALTTHGAINTRRTANGNANPGDAVASTGDSGNVTLAGRALDIGGTVNASATAGRTAGNVTVAAHDHEGIPTGKAEASASVNLRGTLRGNDVSVTAQSTADSAWAFDPNKPFDPEDPDALPLIAVTQLSDVLGMSGIIDVGYLHGVSNATVTLAAGSSIQAAGDATVEAKAISAVQTKAATKGNAFNNKLFVAGIGAAYGEVDSTARVTVANGASIAAGDDVSIRALTENTVGIAANVLTVGQQQAASAAAISVIDVDASVSVEKGASISGDAIEVRAHNQNDFSTSAKAVSDESGVVGAAAAVSVQNVHATATNAADLTGIGSLTVDASTITAGNGTSAKTAVGKTGFKIMMAKVQANAQNLVLDKMTKGLGTRSGLIGDQKTPSTDAAPFRLGSAMTYVDAHHGAAATLAAGTRVGATGDVTINATVEDKGIGQVSGAGVASKPKENNAANIGISAAMNFGRYSHDARALIGAGAVVGADQVAVNSAVKLPLAIGRQEIDDIERFFTTLDTAITGEDELLMPGLGKPITSMVSSKAAGEELGLAGAVNYMEFTNHSSAWIDDNAQVTARTVDVDALTDIISIHLGGKYKPAGASSGGGSAVGGTFNDVIYDNTTLAGIGAGSVVTASGTDAAVDVSAESRNITWIVAPTAGKAVNESLQGMVSIADISDVTRASISNDARITAPGVDVTAVQDDLLVSLAGALSQSSEAAIGLSVAVNNRSSDTHAYIGDNSKDAATATGAAHTAPATVDGFIATDALGVQAETKGLSVAISVAGAVAQNEDPNKPKEKGEPGFLDKLKDSVKTKKQQLTDKANSFTSQVPGLDKLMGKAAGAKPLAASASTGGTAMASSASAPASSTADAQAAAGGSKPQPKFGLSISGSAAVNMARQSTRATLEGATVRARVPGGTQDTTVQAINSAELASASGAAAITRSKAPSSKFNGAMAGAVAYGLIDNTTQAAITGGTVSDVDALAVRALNVGEHTAIGISVGVEASGGNTASASFSGSFSVAQIDNATDATLDDVVVTGAAGAGRKVEITAYDRSRIGIGGGSLYVNTSQGSNANVGAAFTYAETNNATTAAIHGARIDEIDALALRAIDSTLIGSAAAMGGGGSQANGLAGAFIWNDIGNTTRAVVDRGADIEVDGDIAVSARASAPVAELDALVAGGVRNGSGFDFSGSELFANSNSAVPSGTSIISVAGLVQAGKNNIGLSFIGNNVANTHEVSIDNARLDAGTGRVDLDASDNTTIIAASVGVGVASGDFAGLGSAVASMVGNTSRVRINDATVAGGALDAQARDDSAIWSLTGNVTVSKGSSAGVAVSYNKLDNTVESLASDSTLDAATVNLGAVSDGEVWAGAVAGAVANNVAIGGSFGWTESGNRVTAAIDRGAVTADDVTVAATNATAIHTLAGSVAVSKDAAIGAAFNTVMIADATTARIDGTRLDAADDVVVEARGTGLAQTLAVAGAIGGQAGVSGSNSNAVINNTVAAHAANLRGAAGGGSAATARTLAVRASNTMDIDGLAGTIAGGQYAGVGGAIAVNVIGGSTSATLSDSVLDVDNAVTVDADSGATIDAIAVAASGGGNGAFAGSLTTNFVTSEVVAKASNTGSVDTGHALAITADDRSQINSLSGSAAAAGNGGIGAAIAVNRIATQVDAALEGGAAARQYEAGDVLVAATGSNRNGGGGANIRTVAVGLGGGGDVGGAGSLAINLLDNDVRARIDGGARVTSQNDVAVLAHNQQGIDVLAGSVAIGGTAAGVGLGLVVNHVAGETVASISGADTRVNAQAHGAGRMVSDGELADPSAVDVSDITDVTGFVSPNLATGTRTVNGVAVNASSQQNIATAGGSAALSFNPLGSFAVAAIAGTNIIGGSTRATIDGASINQAAGAAGDQQVDVRASSHAMSANFIVGAAGGGSTVAATAAVAANVFSSDTQASISDAQTRANAGVSVEADASHNAVALSVGLAGGLVGGAGSVSMNVFDTRTRAFVHGGSLGAGSLSVDADSTNRANLIAGAGAAGGVGVAGSFLINVGSSDTYAYVGDAGSATTVNVGGALDVDASSTSVMKGVAVSGAAGGAAGVAGMAGVSVLANATKAWVRNATTTSNTLDVSARDTLDLSSYAGALGVSSSGYGVGAAANVAVLANTTSAQIIDSTTTSTGKTTVEAATERKLDAITVTAGVGGTAGIGGAASLLLVGLGDRGDSNSELDKDGTGTLSKVGAISNGPRIDGAIGTSALSASERDGLNDRARFDLGAALAGADDTTSAGIANSTVRASSVDVDADAKLGIRHIAGAAGGGGVGIGGALAYTGVYDATRATISGSSVTTTATSGDAVRVQATSGDLDGTFRAGDARAYAGGAGLVGLGAAIAIANVDRSTQASVSGSLTGASGTSRVDVSASDASTVKADAVGAAAGAAAAGVVVSTANKTSDVSATVAAAVSGHRSMGIDARSAGAVTATGTGAAAGLLAAGTGVGVTASDATVVSAGSSGAVALTGGDLAITASAAPDIDAEALGVTVAGNVGLGASVALAKASVDVSATMAGTLTGTGNLSVGATIGRTSDSADTARAKSVAGTGGVLVGANASVAEASNTSRATASTGDNTLLSRGNTTVTADVDTRQWADSTGVAVGALALGASVAKATSDTTTIARLGIGNQIAGAGTAGDITVRANGTDRNIADTTAGAGGVVSGNAARADTSTTSVTTAFVGNGSTLRARKLDVSATHDSRYAGRADSVNASFVGASGAGIGHAAHSLVSATLGDNVQISTVDDIRVTAQNRFHSDNTGASVSAAGGGVINGSAALVDVALSGTTRATIGAGATLATGLTTGPNGRAGDIHVIASTVAQTSDSAELATGGAIDVAVVKARTLGVFTNDVAIGDGATMDTLGYINVGTYTQANLASTALVNTWGLAAVGVSDSGVDVVSHQNVSIGTGASLEAFRNVYVTAGRDSRNLQDTRLNAFSTSQGYVRGLIAIPSSSAEGHTTSNAATWVKGGADLTSTSNVTAGAYTGAQAQGVDGTGHGYQLGFIPVTQRDSSSGSAGAGTVTIDGALTAGKHNTLAINIDANGNLTQSSGLAVERRNDPGFNPRAFLDAIPCGGDESDGCKGMTALRNSVANSAIGGWILGPMFAGGGDVFLHGDAVGGGGSATAKGAPTITITNNSSRALVLDEITIPDYAGGNVRFTGTAGSAGNVVLSQAPSTAKPTVTIHNAGTASNPGAPIFSMGDIRNIGGLVRMRNDEGSLGLFATVYAQQQIVEAPNGIVTFNNTSANWFSGSNPQSDWRNLLLRPTNPDDAVAYITNAQYGWGEGLLYLPGENADFAGRSITPWGGCLPYNNDTGCGVGPYGTYDFRGKALAATPQRSLYRSLGYADNPSVASNAAGSSFVGQQIYVRANYIDVNSTIDAGAGTNWSLKLMPEMQAWIDGLGGAQGLFDIPAGYVTTIDGGSRLIKARYDATNRRIVVDNVNASGGGYVYLDGKIVSSTPHGKIKVSSGYGKVAIDSAVNLPVQVNDINVGNGAVGVVELVDRQKQAVGLPWTTWYVSRQGQATEAYDNRNGATAWGNPNDLLQNASTYNPTAGMRYRWTETARVGRADRYGTWGWVDSSGQRVDDGQQWSTSNAEFYRDTNADLPAFESRVGGSFSSFNNGWISYGCGNKWGDCNYGFPAPPNGNHWDPDRNGGKGGWETWWRYVSPTRGTITLSGSVKADNPIAIDFSGNAVGSIDVKAQGDLLVNGRLSNSGGNTTLTTANTVRGGVGHVTQTGNTAGVTTRNLKINATGGLGSVNTLFQATLTDNGTLDASTGGWGQYVRLLSGGAVRMLDSGFGSIVLDANGSITGLAGATRDFAGGDITLTSRFGSLGSTTNPLDLDARELSFWGWKFGGRVNARALSDIALTDHSGDFAVNKVISDTGHIRLEAASGNLVDARERTGGGTLDEAQRQAIWARLKLDGSGVAASVAAYEKQVVARYNEYWRLLDVGTVSGGGYTLNAEAIALFRSLAEAAAGRTGLSDAEINAYAANRYADAGATFDTAFGSTWRTQAPFLARQANFAYTLDPASAQYADLARNATWTQGQLKYAINANALEPASGAVGQADPNVIGRNVTLVARDNVGRLAADRNIAYTALTGGTLSDDEAVALALANAPGDVVLVRGDGHVYTRAELLALTPSQIAAGAIANVRVKQTSPLFVQLTGVLNGRAGQAAFLQANGDLAIERFTTNGDARMAATGSIVSGRNDAYATLKVGGDLVLLAGNGRIGASASSTSLDPLVTEIGGRLLSASSGQDVRLRDDNGDLHLGTVFANGTIGLESQYGDVVSVLDGVSLDGQSIELKAAGAIGHRKAATGALEGALKLRVAGSGMLGGSAGGNAWIDSPDRDLHVGTFTAGGDLRVTASLDDLTADDVTAGDALVLGAGGDLVVGTARGLDSTLTAVGNATVGTLDARTATLNAGNALRIGTVRATGDATLASVGATTLGASGLVRAANVDLDAASLGMGAGSRIESSGDIAIDTTGDMVLGALALTGNAVGNDVTLDAGGRIDGNGDGQVNVSGGGNTALSMKAGAGIGTAANPLAIDIGRTTGRASAGDIHLQLPNGGRIDSVVADAGAIGVAAGDALDIGLLQAARSVAVRGTAGLRGDMLLAGDDLAVDIDRDAIVQTLQAGNDVAVRTGGATTLATLAAGRDAALAAGTTLDVATATTGRDFDARSGGALALGTLDAGGNAALDSGASLDAGRVTVGGTLVADAVGALAIDTLRSTVDAHLRAGGRIDLLDAATGRDLVATSGEALRVDLLDVGRDATLDAGSGLVLGDAVIGANLIADAGADLEATTLVVGGNAALDAGRALTLRTAAIGGQLDARSGTRMQLDALDVGSDAKLDAGDDLVIGDADIGGNLAAGAARNVAAAALGVRGNAALAAGESLVLGTGSIGGQVHARSGTRMQLDALDVGGVATLDAGSDLVVGDATIGANLAATAGADLEAVTLAVGGDAVLGAGGSMTLRTASIGGQLDARSGSRMQLDALDVGSDARLDAGTNLLVGSATVGANLTATAGADLAATTLAVGGNAALDAGQALTLRTAAIVGQLDARSGTRMQLDALHVGSDARLDAGTNLLVGSATVGDNLTATAAAELEAVTLAVGGDAVLGAGGSMTLRTASIGGQLDARSGTRMQLDALDVGNDARLDAGDDLVISDADIGGNLAAGAERNVAAAALGVRGNAALAAGESLVLGAGSIGGQLDARSGTRMQLDALDVGGAATLDAGSDLVVGDATIGANLAATAGADLEATTLAVGGNAALDAGRALTLRTAAIAGQLDALSGTRMQLDALDVGGNAVLAAGGALAIGTAAVGGDIDARSGDVLSATVLESGGDARLAAGTDAMLDRVDAGGSLQVRANGRLDGRALRAGRDATLAATTMAIGEAATGTTLDAIADADLVLDRARVGSDATLRAGTTMDLGDVATGRDLDAEASGTLRFATIDGGRDATLTSTGDDVLGGDARATRHLRINGKRRVVFDTAQAGGDATLLAGADIVGTTLRAGGDVTATAGTDIRLATVEGGRAVALDAGEALRLGSVRAGTDLSLTGGSSVDFDRLSAGNNLSLRSRRGHVAGDAIDIGGSATLVAATDVTLGDARVGRDLAMDAGRDLAVDAYAAGGTVSLRSGRDMRIGSGTSGGAQSLLVGGSLGFGTLVSDTGVVLDATGGRIDGTQLVAPVADIAARDAIALDMARIGKRLNMASDTIEAAVTHTGSDMLATRLTGYRDGVAQRIELSVDARDGWLMEKLAALQADLETTATRVSIADGFIGQTMRLDTPAARLWMDNTGATLRMADVQFLELDKRFQLFQTGAHTLTDAYVVRFSPGFRVEVPNYVAPHDWRSLNYLGESAVRFTTRTLNDRRPATGAQVAAPGANEAELVEVQGGAAVNIGAAP